MVVVQADLADGDALGLAGEALDAVEIVRRGVLGVVRLDAGGEVHALAVAHRSAAAAESATLLPAETTATTPASAAEASTASA